MDVRDPLTSGTPSASVRLRRKIALAIGPFTEACTALVQHPRVRELWPEYLVTQHQIIRATVPLTELAGERGRTLAADPIAADLVAYLDEHVDEERGHDDDLLTDLEALGVERETVLARLPSPAVASLVGGQYYWISHHHPVTFLGYVALMEGYPPTPDLVQTLSKRTGLSSEAFRTFAGHGELDPGHRDHLDRVLDSLPLTRAHETMMAISATTTAALATIAVREILER